MRWLLLPALLQTQASVGLGVGTVRYAGGSSVSVASLTPAAQLTTATVVAAGGGTIAALPDNAWFGLGRLTLWGETSRLAGGWQLAGEANATGTSRTSAGPTAAAYFVAEAMRVEPDWGVAAGAGPASGWISGEGGVTALHVRLRTWLRRGEATWAASIEPTRLFGAWFTDVSASVTIEHDRVVATAWSAVRASRAYGSTGAASVLAQWYAVPSLALELGGGSYLRDPYQGFPRARFFTAGVRLLRPAPTHSRAGDPDPPEPVWAPLMPKAHGDTVSVRFEMPGAASVAIAGDWNDWSLTPLTSLGNETWAGDLLLKAGTYHFNLRVDGKEWVVPHGVATVPDGLGGIVGVLIVN